VCQESSLAASLSKEGASSKATADPDTAEAMKTWLEFPHQARELWKKLQTEWHRRLCLAGPRLVLAVEDQNIHHVRMVAVGPSHAIASTESGRLIVWGINHHGCLGLGNRVAEGAVQRLPVELFLSDSLGSVEGDENDNDAGEPKYKYDNRSKKVREAAEAKIRKKREAREAHLSSGIAKIGCGGGHSAILMGDGSVYTWGSGHFGQLGHRDFDDQSTPTRISLAPDYIYKKSPERRARTGARVARRGHASPLPPHAAADEPQNDEKRAQSPGRKERVRLAEETWVEILFADIALGRDHTLALTRDGTVYSFGGNWRGQLGRHTKLHHSTVGKNHKHMLVINSLKANWSVQRAVSKLAIKARGLTKMRDSYPKLVDFHYYGRRADGRFARGKVVSISAHEHASAVLRDDGIVFSWGRVAVPKNAFEAENDQLIAQQLRDGVADTTETILADRSRPVANDMLWRQGYLPRKVAVAEASIMVVFDRQEDSEKMRRRTNRTKQSASGNWEGKKMMKK
jgi:alpha-tubulin suppressor-like RCC1 family protein